MIDFSERGNMKITNQMIRCMSHALQMLKGDVYEMLRNPLDINLIHSQHQMDTF